MSDVDRIKKRFEKHSYTETQDDMNPYPPNKVVSLKTCIKIIDEELAKEPQECNSDLISKKKLIESLKHEDLEFMQQTDLQKCLRSVINNQPQVQPIVRTPEEVVEMLNKISCTECDRNSSHCHFSEKDCKNYWFEWLTKKEV